MEYMKRIRNKYNPKMQFYYMGYYVHNCQKSEYKEHMHPQQLLCPLTYEYVRLTPELKERIIKEQFFKLAEDKPESNHADLSKLEEFLAKFKFVYDRNGWLNIFEIKEDFRKDFTAKISAIHKIMGDKFLDFLFEYQ